jgi:putative membrane protein
MNSYLLFKSLHLISVISWMAGLLYLPRIFVYHSENLKNTVMSQIFKTMERKLYYYIMMPAMLLSWFFGLILISIIGFETLALGWLKLKLIFVILLTIYHFYLGKMNLR